MGTIKLDLEPKWVDLIGLYAEWFQFGTEDQRKIAREELNKLASIGDMVRQSQKKNQILTFHNGKAYTCENVAELHKHIKQDFIEFKTYEVVNDGGMQLFANYIQGKTEVEVVRYYNDDEEKYDDYYTIMIQIKQDEDSWDGEELGTKDTLKEAMEFAKEQASTIFNGGL